VNTPALTVLRYAVTAALAGLTAAYTYYPHMPWIPIAIAVVGTLGIHVVPSALGQQAPARAAAGVAPPPAAAPDPAPAPGPAAP
jgi:hypothetical protein